MLIKWPVIRTVAAPGGLVADVCRKLLLRRLNRRYGSRREHPSGEGTMKERRLLQKHRRLRGVGDAEALAPSREPGQATGRGVEGHAGSGLG